MKRRDFFKITTAAGLAGVMDIKHVRGITPLPNHGIIPRRPYRKGLDLSIIGFGGMVVVDQSQSAADRTVSASIHRGVNYFDVAPSYAKGEAEEKLGHALRPYRNLVFLAEKTTRRDAAGAMRELEQSLTRLHTDYFDLYQLHAVNKTEDIEQILAPGGAMETFLTAREQGKVRFLGFSSHSEEAALILLDRFPFDSVLYPVNFVCMSQGNFGPAVIRKAAEKGVSILGLKPLAFTPWDRPYAEREYPKCWYRPVDRVALAERALRFTLSEPVVSAIPPGDERIYELALNLGAGFRPLSDDERRSLLESAKGLTPLFSAAG